MLLVAAPALAGERPGNDSVYLRNGGLFRGHITELVPKDHVTIEVDGGDTTRVAWGEVDHVIVGPVLLPPATSIAPPVVASAPPPLPPPAEEPGLARVHVSSPKPVFLYRRPPGSTAWEKVCESPCDAELPVSGTYRVTGNGIAAKELALNANAGESVVLEVAPSSTAGVVAGVALTVAGLAATNVAMAMEPCHSAHAASTSCASSSDETRMSDVVGMAGALALVGGIVLIVVSARTGVGVESHRHEAPSPPGPDPHALDAFLRRPTWRSVSSTERAALPTLPLVFERSF
jgi:hypothetical protein